MLGAEYIVSVLGTGYIVNILGAGYIVSILGTGYIVSMLGQYQYILMLAVLTAVPRCPTYCVCANTRSIKSLEMVSRAQYSQYQNSEILRTKVGSTYQVLVYFTVLVGR